MSRDVTRTTNRANPTARTWLVCFGSASLLGVTMAWQRWMAWGNPEKPPFWSAEYLQPAMIPWYTWALIAPILVFVLNQVASAEMTKRRRVATSIDITLIGRRSWVVVNGRPVITDQIIRGTTGSAIDGDESAPGPIMLQGEEQRVEFRNITVSVPRS